jgi:hypothetical protein
MFIESSHVFRMRWTRILEGLACHLHCERLGAIRIQFTCFVAHKSAILTTAKTGRGFLRHVMLIAIGRTVLRLLYCIRMHRFGIQLLFPVPNVQFADSSSSMQYFQTELIVLNYLL